MNKILGLSIVMLLMLLTSIASGCNFLCAGSDADEILNSEQKIAPVDIADIAVD